MFLEGQHSCSWVPDCFSFGLRIQEDTAWEEPGSIADKSGADRFSGFMLGHPAAWFFR